MLAATDELMALAVHLGLAVGIPAAIAVLTGRLAPKAPNAAKLRSYECGVSEQGGPVTRIPIRFALVGMLFLVFDVEALFFYPWAVVVRELGMRGLGIMGSFMVLLVAGYVYARSRGALEWR